MKKLIMIKYGELTTKKANRKVFIQMLENNMFKILITKLLTVNISLIKEKLLHKKIKLLK